MMWYNGPRHHSYYRSFRGSRRPFRFPWMMLPFVFFFVGGGHLWWLLAASVFITLLFIVIQRMAWSGRGSQNAQANYNSMQDQSYYQPGMQGNVQQYYQPYQQGYQTKQTEQTAPGSSEPSYYTPMQEDVHQAYDQPKAEYPQQMPPL